MHVHQRMSAWENMLTHAPLSAMRCLHEDHLLSPIPASRAPKSSYSVVSIQFSLEFRVKNNINL